jgi:hypothetical protein
MKFSQFKIALLTENSSLLKYPKKVQAQIATTDYQTRTSADPICNLSLSNSNIVSTVLNAFLLTSFAGNNSPPFTQNRDSIFL